MKYYKGYSLKSMNSFKLESIAKEIWFPNCLLELVGLLKDLRGTSYNVLAGGTNVILRPEIDRIISLQRLNAHFNINTNYISIPPNRSTTGVINALLKSGCTGIEGLLGLPGSVGGAVFMNSGSGKYTISDYITSVTTLNIAGFYNTYYKDDCKFGRRYSIFHEKPNEIIISTNFNFPRGKRNIDEYNKALLHRKSLPKEPSAGGIFRNWHSLKPYTDKLIGLKVGDAEVSECVNIIVNNGNATYYDVMGLIEKIRAIVKEPLELEVKILC